jgi:Putative Zn-dependent protease, contains TPR repeats
MRAKVKVLSIFALFSFLSCSTLNQVNLYTIDDDKKLGNQMFEQIQTDTKEYPLMDETKYAKAYAQVRQIMSTILQSGQVEHAKDFEWSVKLIDADVLNAFACPGGKMYVYRGLIEYLDNEAELAGVMAHEIGHVSGRHSTRQMTKQYGVAALTSMILGNNAGQLATTTAQIAGNLGGLAFSRSDESEADAFAVRVLTATDYNPLGVAGFFKKMEDEGKSNNTPAILSTHPSSPDRISKITAVWQSLGSKKGNDYAERYKVLKKNVAIK